MPEIRITSLTFGPYAIAHLEGRTIMVPGAVPGDVLEVEIASRRRDWSIAKIIRVITPGPARRHPPCRYLPLCGGCDWQHIEYASQIETKADIVATALEPLAEGPIERAGLVEPAPAEFGYRSRVRLKVGRGGRLGFHQLSSNDIVDIDECLVSWAPLDAARALARAIDRWANEIEVAGDRDSQVIVAYGSKPVSARDREAAKRILEQFGFVKGIVMRADSAREVIGDATITLDVEEGLDLRFDADLFSQVNHAQNRKLVAAVVEMAAVSDRTELLDLFCGVGNLSLAAARVGATVTGADSDALAIAAASANAARLGIERARFLAMKSEDAADFLIRANYKPDVIVVDPPRVGAAELMPRIARLGARSVIYVSCDVATLARDLRVLKASRYSVKRVRAFDFFPNTHHVEVVAHLLLT